MIKKELESAGKDVKTLKNKIEHYNELVEKAREEQRRGMDNLASRDLTEANNHIRNGNRYIVQANGILKSIVREYIVYRSS
ncbi:MAG: hypothetical protein ACXQTD_01255 [Candidatus Syntropharchaeia archaeon]